MNETRGLLSTDQIRALLGAVNPRRVVYNEYTKPHLSQQDVLAHLSRIFGFGRFDVEVKETALLFETEGEKTDKGKTFPVWTVAYSALVTLTVRNERQELVAHYDGGSTGEGPNQPSRADAHDLALKSALSTATKRAAIHLGDQFGLSLYNKGQLSALVMGTMMDGFGPRDAEVDAGVEQQHEDGGTTGERIAQEQDEAAEAPQVDRRRPAVGRQGTKRTAETPPAAERLVASMAAQADPEPEEAVHATVNGQRQEIKEEPAAPAAPVEPEPAPTPSQVTGEEIVREKVAQGPDADAVAAEAERTARRDRAAAEMAESKRQQQLAEEEERAERQRIAAEAEVRALAAEDEPGEEPEYDPEPPFALADQAPTPATWAQLIDAGKVYEALDVAGADTTMRGEERMAEIRGTWDVAEATNQMTTELRVALVKRREELKAELAAALQAEAEAAKSGTP